jgi:hypothetical protein
MAAPPGVVGNLQGPLPAASTTLSDRGVVACITVKNQASLMPRLAILLAVASLECPLNQILACSAMEIPDSVRRRPAKPRKQNGPAATAFATTLCIDLNWSFLLHDPHEESEIRPAQVCGKSYPRSERR